MLVEILEMKLTEEQPTSTTFTLTGSPQKAEASSGGELRKSLGKCTSVRLGLPTSDDIMLSVYSPYT